MAKILQVSGQQLFRSCSAETAFVRSTATAVFNPSDAVREDLLAAAKPFEQMPGYRVLPVLGTTWVFLPLIGKYTLTRAHQYDDEKYKLFGPINRDKFGHLNAITIHDPHDIEAIFRNESKYPSRGDFSTLRIYREMRKDLYKTTGVMVLQGKDWYDLRFKLQKNMLKPKVIQRYVSPMEEVARDLVQIIRRTKDGNNEVPDFLGQLLKWALESVAYVGLDTRLGCLKEKPDEEGMKMIKSAQTIFDCMNDLEAFTGHVQYWRWFSTPTWRKFVRTMDYFSQTGFKFANRTLEQVLKKVDSGKEEELTLVESMLATKGLDVSGTVTMIVDMLMAGVDTTSTTVGFLLYALAKNPEKQEQMYQEILKLLPNPVDRITPDVLTNLTYVKHCIKESQRLYPIIRGTARELDRDMVLSGYRVPAGTVVLAGHYVTQRQEKYFKDALKFIPERWADDINKARPFAFLPFGFGIRSCIGRRLAELEIQCLAIEIIRNFKVEYHHEDVGLITRLVNVPDRPLRFSFLERR